MRKLKQGELKSFFPESLSQKAVEQEPNSDWEPSILHKACGQDCLIPLEGEIIGKDEESASGEVQLEGPHRTLASGPDELR